MAKVDRWAEAERIVDALTNLEADVRRLKTNIEPAGEYDWRARDEVDEAIMSLHNAKRELQAATAFLFYRERRDG